MNYDTEAYEQAVNKWFEELKDIVVSDLLQQHILKYPEKKDFEVKDENIPSDDNEPTQTN